MKKSRKVRYEVRSKGDGNYPYFVEYPYLAYYSKPKYNETNMLSAKKYAKSLENAWVVQITEKVV
jgi:hypothetical protein